MNADQIEVVVNDEQRQRLLEALADPKARLLIFKGTLTAQIQPNKMFSGRLFCTDLEVGHATAE